MVSDIKLSELHISADDNQTAMSNSSENEATDDVQITCFTEDLNDVTLHFQIIRLTKQIYAWIGCNSAKFGHLYAAGVTRPNNTVAVTSLHRGSTDNTGSSIARRLVLKTGLSIILACNIPKDSPMLEEFAELTQNCLRELFYHCNCRTLVFDVAYANVVICILSYMPCFHIYYRHFKI